ncbi:DUF2911 domain-containing protein [Psychroserpens ponticola]|uniref:DUF2911 domain-containing protein n=1 Tax=Psychroserpens ponticola TaxID=2932268 RepID=A0ABY7RTU1_9FLAO|nr:DUF2911 domain-containing protein [Psychroserpens ponticola]WCO00539.1 DUF2911 domain-containing protein [Psychroserpens ponticola]
MKKLLLVFAVFAIAFNVNAQIETPQPSPFSKVEQKVGLTDVSIEYSRPNMRGRTIFGDLVPYGKLWRTGANKNTMITFSDDVTVEGKELKAGSYAIFVTPSEKSWEVVFYSNTENWGTPSEWDDTKVAAKVTAEVYPIPMKIETFTISFDDLTSESANIGLMWENAYVGVKFDVPTDKSVTNAIDKIMAGPGADDYYAAARYYLESDKDIDTAVKWIDRAIDMTKDQPRFWWLRQQALIHAKAGNKDKAIEAAKASMAGAKEAKNDGYVKMNMESLKEWGAM